MIYNFRKSGVMRGNTGLRKKFFEKLAIYLSGTFADEIHLATDAEYFLLPCWTSG